MTNQKPSIDLIKVEQKASELNNSLEKVNQELKRIASIKCRLKKQKGRSDYSEQMLEVLAEEQLLKEAKQLISPKKKFVTSLTQYDVDQLDYDETVKALKSIQCKKTLSKWLTDVEGDNDEYRNAVKIETMLKERRKVIKPIDDLNIRKSDVETIIETLENSGKLSKQSIIELLKELV